MCLVLYFKEKVQVSESLQAENREGSLIASAGRVITTQKRKKKKKSEPEGNGITQQTGAADYQNGQAKPGRINK